MEHNNRYDKLDGLRAYAAIGIVMMHVLANGGYALGGFVFDRLIPAFTDLVFLFMVISGFSMCCGYYDKIVNAKITPAQFYGKRFKKVWPFFAVLCLLELCVSPSLNAFYEVIANLTLCFGLLPNANISVIGVGNFLGVVFVFYLLFPFFCFLLENKARGWFAVAASLVIHGLSLVRFGGDRANIMYCAAFFLSGGMLFLYRQQLSSFVERYSWLTVLALAVSIAIYYWAYTLDILVLPVGCLAVILALKPAKGKRTFLSNEFIRKVSGISLELYLSHMVIFRVLEKLRLTHMTKVDIADYAITVIITIVGAVGFSLTLRKGLSLLGGKLAVK